LDRDPAPGCELASGREDREPSAHAGAGRRAIELSVREDTHVAAVARRLASRAHEDGPVEETELGRGGMADRAGSHDRALDRPADGDQALAAGRLELQA